MLLLPIVHLAAVVPTVTCGTRRRPRPTARARPVSRSYLRRPAAIITIVAIRRPISVINSIGLAPRTVPVHARVRRTPSDAVGRASPTASIPSMAFSVRRLDRVTMSVPILKELHPDGLVVFMAAMGHGLKTNNVTCEQVILFTKSTTSFDKTNTRVVDEDLCAPSKDFYEAMSSFSIKRHNSAGFPATIGGASTHVLVAVRSEEANVAIRERSRPSCGWLQTVQATLNQNGYGSAYS